MIKKYNSSQDDLDYDFLKKEGLEHIKRLAGKIWTDHNIHDPGITFLEVLCYAITDLGYRISAPIKDLLSKESNAPEDLTSVFPTAKQIFTTKAITEKDYRKLLIDIEGVKNAFIRADDTNKIYTHCSTKAEVSAADPKGRLSYEKVLPHYEQKNCFTLQGLNKIYFEPDLEISLIEDELEKASRIQEVKEEIIEKYHANRNLCEDLFDVCQVEEYEVNICGDIEIDRTANATEVLAEVLFRVQEHLSPSVPRHRLADLLDSGLKPDDIFNGPVLDYGFITDESLDLANFRTEIRLSDIIQIISETPGVKRIQKLSMNNCPCNEELDLGDCPPLENKWKICLPEGFDKVIRLCTDNSIINIFKDVVPIDVDRSAVEALLEAKTHAFNDSLKLSYDDLEIPQGEYLNSGEYFSIQNDLPNIYGVGEIGLSNRLPVKRHAQALQLKAYLTFFDQILSTYFSHLQHIGDMLSHKVGGNQSYFNGKLDTVKDLTKILKNPAVVDEEVGQYLGELEDYVERKGRFLDHLLARFAENLNDYVFLMVDLFGIDFKETSLFHKSKLLSDYITIGSDRACAMNYYGLEHGTWDTDNISGLQRRLSRLLGIRNYTRRHLTDYPYEFYEELNEENNLKWKWRIRHTEGYVMFFSKSYYDSQDDAETDMWKKIPLAWDVNNYEMQLNEDDQWIFILLDKSKDEVASQEHIYPSQLVAQETIQMYAEYMFDKVTDEGMYVFENILHRPDLDDPEADEKFIDICMDPDCLQCEPIDPYSFRLTVVLPGWTKRFSNMYFRDFAEKVIREEVPAHIVMRICWIGAPVNEDDEVTGQMEQLQELYKSWITEKMTNPSNQKDNEWLKPLVDLIHDLETIYPQGTLHDCSDGGASESAMILNQSSLGEIKNNEDDNE